MYKKNTKQTGRPMRLYQKIGLIMRLTTMILLCGLLQVSAASFGQKITLDQNNLSLRSFMKEIRKQSGFDFYYDSRTVSDKTQVSVKVKGVTLEEALKEAFSGKALEFEIRNKIILIKRKEQAQVEERSSAQIQEIEVSGKVVDEQGRAIGGASVLVKTTGKGMATNVDGTFVMRGVKEGELLLVKYLGYDVMEVKAVANLGVLRLKPATNDLDAVQIQAYAKSSKRLSTSNITTVRAEEIERQPVTNPLLALQGRVPGLEITQATGTPGSTIKVRINGTNSLRGSNEPFYVVDGVPFNSTTVPMGGQLGFVSSVVWGAPSTTTVSPGGGLSTAQQTLDPGGSGNPFMLFNPMDIESIEVLRDADATAIYGSRAANGAILITTKKGKVGKLKVDFDVTSGTQSISRRIKLLNTQEYLELRREAFANANMPPNSTAYDLNGPWDQNSFTDWQDLVFDNQPIFSRAGLTLGGGSTNTSFRTSIYYNRQDSPNPIGKFNDQQFSGSFSLDTRSNNERFRMQLRGGYSRDNNRLPAYDLTSVLLYLPPVAPSLYNGDGSLNKAEDATGRPLWPSGVNPLLNLYNKFNSKTTLFSADALLVYNIMRGLDFSTTLGYNATASEQYTNMTIASLSTQNLNNGIGPDATFGNSEISNVIVEPKLNYNLQFGKSRLALLLGGSIQHRESKSQTIYATGQLNDAQLESLAFGTSFTTTQLASNVYKYAGVFAQANYNFGGKYILNLTGRRDGSSRFGFNNQYNTFGALGAGFIFSEEEFVKNKLRFLSFGKIRASYGTTGNDGVGDYSFMDLHEALVIGSGTMAYQTNGLFANRLLNADLKWELNKKLSVGIDLNFLKDRISLSASYDITNTSNQVQALALPAQGGIRTIFYNFPGLIRNNTLSFVGRTENIKNKVFMWTTSFNLTLPKDKLVSFDQTRLYTRGLSGKAQSYIVGQPLSARWAYRFAGVDPLTGYYTFEDKNGNPTQSPANVSGLAEDHKVLVNPASTIYGGVDNSFSYMGFSLNISLNFRRHQLARYVRSTISSNATPGDTPNNHPIAVLDRWRKPGDVSSNRKVQWGTTANYRLFNSSDEFFEDASFIRLRNVSLAWSLPRSWISRLNMENCVLSINVQNLATLTGYSGLDPESANALIPPYRTITFGLRAGF